jgi:hypothetical protein
MQIAGLLITMKALGHPSERTSGVPPGSVAQRTSFPGLKSETWGTQPYRPICHNESGLNPGSESLTARVRQTKARNARILSAFRTVYTPKMPFLHHDFGGFHE